MYKRNRLRLRKRPAQGLVEYGLILVLVMVVVVFTVALTGDKINTMFSVVTSQLADIIP